MTAKPLLKRTAALILALALLLMLLPITAQAAEAKPLSEHQIGTVFKLEENGTLFEWILISHNYEGIGNQLLMRKDTINYYNDELPVVSYTVHSEDDGSYYSDNYYIRQFFDSEPYHYLNEEYTLYFNEPIRNSLVEIEFETYSSVKSCSKAASNCGDSCTGGTLTITKKPAKIFILSPYEMGYTGIANIVKKHNYNTGAPLMENMGEFLASDQIYWLRDGHNCLKGTSVAAGTGVILDSNYTNNAYIASQASGGNWNGGRYYINYNFRTAYYRPCLVLPADTVAIEGEEIKGEVIPTIESVTVPDEWAQRSSITINATDAAKYAVTTDETQPVSGWQTANSFNLTANGSYYAWVKSVTDNVASMQFEVSRVDSSPPVISAVAVPDEWATSGNIRITAADSQSGVSSYTVTAEDIEPSEAAIWQASPQFSFNENGYYYAWAKDKAGNISACYGFRLDKIDTDKPVISEICYPDDWTNSAELTITAADATSSLVYAVSSSSTEPLTGWQEQPKLQLNSNGSFYAWAKDQAGNSAYKYFYFSKYDGTAPEISNVHFNTNNTVMTVSANDYASGVKAIIIDAVEHEGGYTQYQIPAGTRYITIQAKDKAGNISEERKVRVPGWYDTLGSLAITSVEFDADITTATIKAETTDTAIKGIYVNDKLYAANPVVYALGTTTKYLVMQVEDVNGDRSALYKVRVPGWTAESPSLEITNCVFSEDNNYATITATENPEKEEDRRGITGIKVNGEFIEGNPVAYPIPEGTRHLEMIAYNTDGDYSPTLIRRVPGWSEVVSTLSIINCEFSDYNKRATVTALATGGDSVAGIFVNGEFFEGNPVVYDIDKDTDVLHLQAANFNGDLSAMVNRDVPRDTSKATLKLTITAPEWTSAARAKVKITATDKYDIRELLAKAGEDSEWEDITDTRYIYITEDTTVWASAENDEGAIKEAYLDIVCFDRNAPTVTAAQQDKVVNIRAEDDKSGIKAIYVNNVEYSGSQIYGGNLRYTIPEGVTTVTVKAVDEAGNESQMVELGVKATVTAIPMMIAPSEPPAPEPEPPAAVIPEPEPEPEVEAEPEPEPIPEPETQEEPEAAGMTTAQMAAIAGGVFAASSAATGGTIWWLMRKRRMNQVVPELDYKGYRLKYDESDYGGSVDPLDKSNVTEVVFNRKIS